VTFSRGKALGGAIQFLVGQFVSSEKLAIGGFEVPVIDGVKMKRPRNISQKLGASVMRVTLEELRPHAGRTIGFFEAGFTSWLDFELPEDYKHRCPIFCSRIIAFQHNFITGSLACWAM